MIMKCVHDDEDNKLNLINIKYAKQYHANIIIPAIVLG